MRIFVVLKLVLASAFVSALVLKRKKKQIWYHFKIMVSALLKFQNGVLFFFVVLTELVEENSLNDTYNLTLSQTVSGRQFQI